jgi:hypothetical protein
MKIAFVIFPVILHRAFAWGTRGHRAVATIAFRHLSPSAQITLRPLDEKAFVEASLWADTIETDEDMHFVHFRTDNTGQYIPYSELVIVGMEGPVGAL